MYKITAVIPEPEFKLQLNFEDGSQVVYNMQKLVKIIPYNKLSDWEYFRKVRFDENCVYWETEENKPEYFPLSISFDTILFSLRA